MIDDFSDVIEWPYLSDMSVPSQELTDAELARFLDIA